MRCHICTRARLLLRRDLIMVSGMVCCLNISCWCIMLQSQGAQKYSFQPLLWLCCLHAAVQLARGCRSCRLAPAAAQPQPNLNPSWLVVPWSRCTVHAEMGTLAFCYRQVRACSSCHQVKAAD